MTYKRSKDDETYSEGQVMDMKIPLIFNVLEGVEWIYTKGAGWIM